MQQPSPPALDMAIIVVSYNVRDLLRRCLESVRGATATFEQRCQIVVVDNASLDGSADMVCAAFPEVMLVALPTNVGFAAGNNAALRSLLDPTLNPPRYVMLLNPDTEIVGDALQQLMEIGECQPDVVVAGPQLRYTDGTVQSSRRRWPTLATLFWESTLLEQWWPQNPWVRRYHCADQPADVTQQVDWLVGAALLVRCSAIKAAGLLDERFFMYSEELEWQARLGQHGRILYVPDAIILHHEGKSSEQNLARRHINFSRSKLRYAQLRWGSGVAAALRLFLLLGYLLQAGIESAKWLVGHKRSLRRQRIVQYSTILRSGL